MVEPHRDPSSRHTWTGIDCGWCGRPITLHGFHDAKHCLAQMTRSTKEEELSYESD